MEKKGFTKITNPALAENPELETAIDNLLYKNHKKPKQTATAPETEPQASTGIKLKRPQKQPRNQHIQILVTASQKDKLKRIASALGMSVNEVINQAIDSLSEEN